MYYSSFHAWAIDIGNSLIGRYWWFNNKAPSIPPSIEGCRIALFKTRRIARENLPSVKEAHPKAKVVQVRLKIEKV